MQTDFLQKFAICHGKSAGLFVVFSKFPVFRIIQFFALQGIVSSLLLRSKRLMPSQEYPGGRGSGPP
jgi:hypothetical protein